MIFPTCQPVTLFLARTVIFTQISPPRNPEGSWVFVPLLGTKKEKIIIVLSVKTLCLELNLFTPDGGTVCSLQKPFMDLMWVGPEATLTYWGARTQSAHVLTVSPAITQPIRALLLLWLVVRPCCCMPRQTLKTNTKAPDKILSFELWISQPAHVCQHQPVLMAQMACRGQLVSK